MKISLIGSGNVAHALGHLFQQAGHHIQQVISPHEAHARELAEKISAAWSDDLEDVDARADMVLLAVRDSAIPLLNDRLKLGSQLVVHTAGAVPMNAIAAISTQIGVFYPLQTIHRDLPVSANFPLLLESNQDIGHEKLASLAESVSDNVVWMSSDERLRMHVAGVFCNNFTNHLMALAENFCQKESLDFTLLLPLMRETINRLNQATAAGVQTGPARRDDITTMQMHEQVLEKYPEMLMIYQIFSAAIHNFYINKK